MFSDLRARLRSLFHGKGVEDQLDEELRFHLEQQTEKYIQSGMTPEEAARRARIELGGVERAKEEHRDARGIRLLEDTWRDAYYAARMLRKSPGFTIIAVITLALGIGANTAIFSVVNGVYLRRLPVPNASELVSLGFMSKGNPGIPVSSYPDLVDMRNDAEKLVDLFAYRVGMQGLSESGRANRVLVSYVTGNFFSALGLKPALGRLILPSEGRLPGNDPVMVLGYSFWQSRFAANPNVLGKVVQVGGRPVTIVGVAPKGFYGPLEDMDMQAYLPLNVAETGTPWNLRSLRNLFVLGRLRHGVRLAHANAAMQVIASRLSREHPRSDSGATIWLLPQKEAMLNPFPRPGEYRPQMMAVGLFLVLALLVLLLACSNLANIMLVRGTVREGELAVRTALGAGRGRLVRQMLTESFLVAILGCVAGVGVGVSGSALIQSIHFSSALPVSFNLGLDWHVLLYAIGAAILSGAAVGLVPALRSSMVRPERVLHETTRTASGRRNFLRDSLVVAQICGSVALLIVAGLFTGSLFAAQRMNLGFDPSHVLMLSLNVGEAGYNQSQGQHFFDNLLRRVRALPGVQAASLSSTYPSNTMTGDFRPIRIENRPVQPGQGRPLISVDVVSTDYFRSMGIPILRGRSFMDSDTTTAPRVAVINQTMAKLFWPDQNAIGRRFSISLSNKPRRWIQVVGIAQNGKYRTLFANAVPYFYLPLAQNYSAGTALLVKTSGPPEGAIATVEMQVHSLAPGLPVYGAQTMNQTLNDSSGGFYSLHFGVDMAGALGLLGLLLAVVSVYGVTSYRMSRRTHEIGIRVALGAQPRDILWPALRQGLNLVAAGSLLGILIALALSRATTHLLYGVSAHDPLTYFVATATAAFVTLVACYVPARRAMRIDPAEALRHE